MKPKTALQKLVVELKEELPPITDSQFLYAEKNVFDKWGVISRNKIHCLECAHNWKLEKNEVITKSVHCPNCDSLLKMQGQNATVFTDTAYSTILTTCKGFQVVRIIFNRKYMKKGVLPGYSQVEVMQHWIDSNGKCTSFAKKVNGFSMYYDSWIVWSEMTLKDNSFQKSSLFYLNPYKIHPYAKLLPIVKRNGIKTSFHEIAPHELIIETLSNPVAEYLLKTKQLKILKHMIYKNESDVLNNEKSIKLAYKNGYKITDFVLWKDYVALLKHFGKDVNSPKYICPTDLKKSHDKLVDKRRIEIQKQTLESLKSEIKKNQKAYTKSKKAFFGLQFSEAGITVKVLKSVKEFLEEGGEMSHCVFTNQYFKKKNSLILSASMGGKKLETIEVALDKLTIIQSRGKGNKATKYNSQIIDLVTKNLPKINAIYKQAS